MAHKFGLLGYNIEYSRSPQIFETIFKITGSEGSFQRFDLSPDELPAILPEIFDSGMDGLSVTIPYKKTIMNYVDTLDESAKSLKVSNSIHFTDGKIIGYNTDVDGFAFSLHKSRKKIQDRRAIILGNGGVARAVVYSLSKNFDIKQFVIVGRGKEKLDEFYSEVQELVAPQSLEATMWEDFDKLLNFDYGLMVNCTPLGGGNYPDEMPFPSSDIFARTNVYFDTNYNKGNKAIKAAKKQGALTVDGSIMLVAQAIRSYNIWTGEKVDFDAVYSEVFGKKRK